MPKTATTRDALYLARLLKANYHDAMDRGDVRGALDAVSRAKDARARPSRTRKAASYRDALWVGRTLAKRASGAAPASAFARFDAAELAKADDEQRIVYGIASTPDVDNQPGVWEGQRYAGDVVETGAIEAALEDYLEYGNVREMHAAKAVGTIIKAEMVNGQLRIAVRVEDDDAWRKVKAGVYKGFSIGGRAVKAILARLADGRLVRRIKKLLLTEISLVDRPANPAARILLFKGADMADETETEDRAALDLAALVALAKAAPNPDKAVSMLQSMRDEVELAGDVEAAGLLTQAISLVMQAVGGAEPQEDEAAETEEVTEETEAEVAMAEATEDDPGALAMAARAELLKASRMRMGKRLPGIVSIAKSLLQLAADAGDEASQRALKAYGAEPVAVKALTEADVTKALDAALTKALAPVAAGVLNTHQRLAVIEAQPVGGGPVTRLAGQPIAKRLGDAPPPAVGTPDPATLAHLRRLAVTESDASRRAQYQEQLKQLEAAQR